jgi:hypothetical protein
MSHRTDTLQMPPRFRRDALGNAQLGVPIEHPHWEPLGPVIDALATQIPATTERAERTTLLTWIHTKAGIATFEELSQRLTGMASLPKRKKHLRQALRAMEKLSLVEIVSLPADGEDAPDLEDKVVGKNSVVSLTWTGMLWLKRAWVARERLSRDRSIVLVHRELVKEEDEAGWADPYWVENVRSVHPEGAKGHHVKRALKTPSITSIFDLAARKGPAIRPKRG